MLASFTRGQKIALVGAVPGVVVAIVAVITLLLVWTRGSSGSAPKIEEVINNKVIVPAVPASNVAPLLGGPSVVGATPDGQSWTLTVAGRALGGTVWAPSVDVEPDATVEMELAFENTSPKVLQEMALGINLAPGMAYVPASTKLKNSDFPKGVSITSDHVVADGILVGSYDSRAVGYLLVRLQVAPASSFQCGETVLTTYGLARPKAEPLSDPAPLTVRVERFC
jgi:hypothetical protein